MLATILLMKQANIPQIGQTPENETIEKNVATNCIRDLIAQEDFAKIKNPINKDVDYKERIELILKMAIKLLADKTLQTNKMLPLLEIKENINLNRSQWIENLKGHFDLALSIKETDDAALTKIAEALQTRFLIYVEGSKIKPVNKEHSFHYSWLRDIYLKTPLFR